MPVFASPEPTPTEADIATLRRLIGPDARTDEALTPYLERHRCPHVDEETGEAYTTADHYGAAAEVWEERALVAEATAAASTSPAVTSRRHGDAAETYATGTESAGSPRAMFAIARRLRRRSCNWSAAATVAVTPPNDADTSRLHDLDATDTFATTEPDFGVVALDRTNRRAVVNAAEPRD